MPQPACVDLTYILSTTNGQSAVTADIDLAKDLSAVNRRLYRQGMHYAISGISFVLDPSVAASAAVIVQTAPNTWMVHNAWKKGKALWDAQQREVAKVMPGIKGTWDDFKIELDDNSTTAIDTVAGDTGTIVPDEWNLSNFVWDDDGTERSPTFCLLGATAVASKIGLVQEYHISRARPHTADPNVGTDASDSVYAKSLGTDEMSDTLIDLVEGENDDPPYDNSEMPGGDTVADAPHTRRYSSVHAANPTGHISGFDVPCGLLRVSAGLYAYDVNNGAYTALTSGTGGVAITVHMVPGNYKGVLANPMGQ